jgi:transcriptional regulator with XRE-family HTH domain
LALGERIREVRKSLPLKPSQTDFGVMLGLSRAQIKTYELNVVEAPESTIRLICREFSVDYDWLKTGVGEMFGSADEKALAALDDLMNGDEHEETRALIKALASLDAKQLDVIDVLIARIKKELGN